MVDPTKTQPAPSEIRATVPPAEIPNVPPDLPLNDLAGIKASQLPGACGRAYRLLSEGKVDLAREAFEILVLMDPRIGPFHTGLGKALMQGAELDEAIEQFDAALKISENDAVAMLFRAEAYLRKGELMKAWPDLKKIIENDKALKAETTRRALMTIVATLREMDKRGIVPGALEDFRSAITEKLETLKPKKQTELSAPKAAAQRDPATPATPAGPAAPARAPLRAAAAPRPTAAGDKAMKPK